MTISYDLIVTTQDFLRGIFPGDLSCLLRAEERTNLAICLPLAPEFGIRYNFGLTISGAAGSHIPGVPIAWLRRECRAVRVCVPTKFVSIVRCGSSGSMMSRINQKPMMWRIIRGMNPGIKSNKQTIQKPRFDSVPCCFPYFPSLPMK